MSIFRSFSKPPLPNTIGGIALLVFLVCGCCSTQSFSKARVETDPEMSVGAYAVSLRDKRVLLSMDAQKLFTPSSTAKIVTIAAALRYLGSHHRYDTEVYASKRVGSSVKNLYLKASGDPSFSSLDLAKLVAELKQLGIRSVKGDIVIDASVFDDVAYGKGWMLDDMNEGYSAPISGISVDSNRLVFGFIPGAKAGETVGVTLFPQTSYFKHESKAVTTNKGQAKIVFKVEGNQGVTRGSKVDVEANLPLSSITKYESLAVNDPVDFAGFLLMEELKKNKIAFNGKVTRSKVPSEARLLTHHLSAPLSEMAIDFMKMSNNHAAESLLKSIGAQQSAGQGTFESGLAALKRFLIEDVKTNVGNMVAVDGSGLSRYNQLSAKLLSDVLSFMWQDFRTGPEFVSSLALFGEDGTLKGTKNEAFLGKIRAKTGSMTNLKSLAGYFKRDDGDIIAFAILTSGGSANKQQKIEDILTSLRTL